METGNGGVRGSSAAGAGGCRGSEGQEMCRGGERRHCGGAVSIKQRGA